VADPQRITMHIDNQSAISRIKHEGNSGAQKAVDIRFHAIKDAYKSQGLQLQYVSTKENVADLLTKSLGPTELKRKCSIMGLS
jgi:hypothetical protein